MGRNCPYVLEGGMIMMLYDREHDKYLTADNLRESFLEDEDAVERFEGNFSAYFDECTGKNGLLEIMEV